MSKTAFAFPSFQSNVINSPISSLTIAEYMDYEKHKQHIANSHQNMEERKQYAENIYLFTCLWFIFMVIVIIGKGLGKLDLSDTVLVTFITSTTVSAFGFFTYVTKYLFNTDKST